MQLFTLSGTNFCNTGASEPASVARMLGRHLSLLPTPLTDTDNIGRLTHRTVRERLTQWVRLSPARLGGPC
jgi:hypothetical protein